ncbi:MAG: hypothetical protein WA977_08750 [Halobacteriota archaeon]
MELEAWQALHLNLTFSKLLSANPAYHIAATMQIFSSFFCDAFAKVQLILRSCGSGVGGVERNAARSSAWPALYLSLTFSCHIAAHRAAFSARAFCKVQLILR